MPANRMGRIAAHSEAAFCEGADERRARSTREFPPRGVKQWVTRDRMIPGYDPSSNDAACRSSRDTTAMPIASAATSPKPFRSLFCVRIDPAQSIAGGIFSEEICTSRSLDRSQLVSRRRRGGGQHHLLCVTGCHLLVVVAQCGILLGCE